MELKYQLVVHDIMNDKRKVMDFFDNPVCLNCQIESDNVKSYGTMTMYPKHSYTQLLAEVMPFLDKYKHSIEDSEELDYDERIF